MTSRTSPTPASMRRETTQLIKGLGARLAGRAERGRDRPVHRGSYDVHDRRAQVSRRLADGSEAGVLAFIDCLLRTAREFDVFARDKGGVRPLRPSGVAVLEAVLRNHWHDFRTGRVDPALSQIMKATGYVRQTVVDALKRLDAHGFLSWVRRTELIEDPEPDGPTRRQVSNSYFVDLAQLARKAGDDVARRFDQFWSKAALRLALAAKRGTPAAPTAPAEPKRPRDPELAALLGRMQATVDGRAADPCVPSLDTGLSPGSGSKE